MGADAGGEVPGKIVSDLEPSLLLILMAELREEL